MMQVQTTNKNYTVIDDLYEKVLHLSSGDTPFNPELMFDAAVNGSFLIIPEFVVLQ